MDRKPRLARSAVVTILITAVPAYYGEWGVAVAALCAGMLVVGALAWQGRRSSTRR